MERAGIDMGVMIWSFSLSRDDAALKGNFMSVPARLDQAANTGSFCILSEAVSALTKCFFPLFRY